MSREEADTVIRVAEQFGEAIVRADFEAAHALLTAEMQRTHSPAALEAEVADMIAYSEDTLRRAIVVTDVTMVDWPAKQPGDLAWVYVALEGDSFSEAVTVILTNSPQGTRIRELEWGRP